VIVHDVPVRGRPRPRLFRALGPREPPLEIEIAGRPLRRVEILKHDSWAATALYEGHGGKVVCKFNRQEPILAIPMQWLGRRLAFREAWILHRMSGHPGMPRASGPVQVAGAPLAHAVAHDYIEGHPLTPGERVGDEFFPRLRRLVDALHALGVAYVDLAKRANIIVGHDGYPYLIDYQISARLPHWWPGNAWPIRRLIRALQAGDDYHVLKHWSRHRPDQLPPDGLRLLARRPASLRIAVPVGRRLRMVRRRLLVSVGVRTGRGLASSEAAPEEAVRRHVGRLAAHVEQSE